jgi:hypothetical protein
VQHPDLQKTLRDMEYENRFNRGYAQHLLMLLPLLVYAAVSYVELGVISAPAVTLSACSYLLVIAVIYRQVRKRTLDSMRREGVVDDTYQPPS